MAENKKAVIVYADWIEQFEALNDEEAGKLIKHIFRYVNDLNPVAPDRLTELQFIPLKTILKRDLDKWEKTLEGRSKAGKASAEARKLKEQTLTNSTSVESVEQNPTNPTDIVIVNDNVIVKDKEIPKGTNIPDWNEFLTYTKEKEPNIKISALKNKYDAWIENDWKDGNNKKIIKWKVKVCQTLPYIEKTVVGKDEFKYSSNFQHPNKPISL